MDIYITTAFVIVLFGVGFNFIWWYLPKIGTSRYLSHIQSLVLARPNDKKASKKARLGGTIILIVGTLWFVVGALSFIAFLYDRALRLWG